MKPRGHVTAEGLDQLNYDLGRRSIVEELDAAVEAKKKEKKEDASVL